MISRTAPFTALKFGAAIARNPRAIDTFIPVALHPSRTTWDTGVPMWNAHAIAWLADHLPEHGRVWEWGCGGSTVWLSGHGQDVTSIESEAEWADRVSSRCGASVRLVPGTDDGTMRSEPQLRDRGVHFFDEYVTAIDAEPDESFDIVIIDGICRKECARQAVAKVRPGGLAIVDDTNLAYLAPCLEPFAGWEFTRVRGFTRLEPIVYETTFCRRPV
ncbi:MAG TPA: hypothetical protein VNF47_14235 [Streptosporangiaceae bacterium]|nr:hypothetical protein [Streptosporangiaceae bacterium]